MLSSAFCNSSANSLLRAGIIGFPGIPQPPPSMTQHQFNEHMNGNFFDFTKLAKQQSAFPTQMPLMAHPPPPLPPSGPIGQGKDHSQSSKHTNSHIKSMYSMANGHASDMNGRQGDNQPPAPSPLPPTSTKESRPNSDAHSQPPHRNSGKSSNSQHSPASTKSANSNNGDTASKNSKPELNPACLPRCNSEELMKIDAKLETKELWEKFHELGTEMIITKTGRR